ncbi:MAG TPA: UbiA-like polyprenyltransferase [Candidatus Bathyarchaeia archaeon]|nr:UbiA-like polyprenyltransferase [Candidatus Bathyarchaeia archaeon]
MPHTLRHFLDAIKFEHTVFALPFAYVSMVLAAGGWPGLRVVVWVTLAMAAARTLAMSVNRLADRAIDAANPRTAGRHLPTGLLRPSHMLVAAMLSGALLALSAWMLNPLCLKLAPLAALFLIGYSYTKRFTWTSHWILGFTDGIAAAGGWIAVRGAFEPPALVLWFALTVWIAGFDLIYACQDVDFDRRTRLHSFPARFGIRAALAGARACHLLTVGAFVLLGVMTGLGWLYWVGVLAVGALLVYEHSLVSPDDLSRLDVAFFNVNGYIAVILFAAVLGGRLW